MMVCMSLRLGGLGDGGAQAANVRVGAGPAFQPEHGLLAGAEQVGGGGYEAGIRLSNRRLGGDFAGIAVLSVQRAQNVGHLESEAEGSPANAYIRRASFPREGEPWPRRMLPGAHAAAPRLRVCRMARES